MSVTVKINTLATTENSIMSIYVSEKIPRWGTEDEEIKDPSVENPGLKGSPFKA